MDALKIAKGLLKNNPAWMGRWMEPCQTSDGEVHFILDWLHGMPWVNDSGNFMNSMTGTFSCTPDELLGEDAEGLFIDRARTMTADMLMAFCGECFARRTKTKTLTHS